MKYVKMTLFNWNLVFRLKRKNHLFVMMHETFPQYEPLQNKTHSNLNTSISHMTLLRIVYTKYLNHINIERLSFDELWELHSSKLVRLEYMEIHQY